MASPYRTRYNDPHQIESDHKDIVISQLKAEAFELRQGERDFEDLQARVNNLNHRCDLLKDERALDEKEHNSRHELNTQTIAELKDEVAALKAELRTAEGDIREVKTDNHKINGVVSGKSAELAKLKSDLSDLTNENAALTHQTKDLERLIEKVQKENQEREVESEKLNNRVEEVSGKKEENEAIVKQLEGEVDGLLKRNDELKNEANQLKGTAAEKGAQIRKAEHQISENKKKIISSESRLKDKQRLNERLTNDIEKSEKGKTAEAEKTDKNNEKIASLEATVQEKDAELEDLKAQIADLKKDQAEVAKESNDVANDLKNCTKHLDSLIADHANLLNQIEKVDREDDQIRAILKGREKLAQSGAKYQEKLKVTTDKLQSSLLSPVKTASTNAEAEVVVE